MSPPVALRVCDCLLPLSSTRSGQLATALGSWYPGVNLPGSLQSTHAPHAAQISPGKNANCRCTSAAFTVGLVPLGFASTGRLASTPSAFYAVSVRRLAPLALRLPSHDPSRSRTCLRLVVIMLIIMSPCRYSHRGLAPHKFAPMLGAPRRSSRHQRHAAVGTLRASHSGAAYLGR